MKLNKFMLAAAAVVALASCNKDETGEEKIPDGAFNASAMEEYIYTVKSTVSDEGKVAWEENDDFNINGVDYVLFKGAGSNIASIIPAEKDVIAEPLVDTPFFKACTPAALLNIEKSTYELPSIIKNLGHYNPMYAVSCTNELEFKNICGILQLNVRGNKKLASIDLCCSSVGLAGRYQLDKDVDDTTKFVMKNINEFRGPLRIEFKDGVDLSASGKVFMIPIAAKTYKDFKARFTTTDGMVAEYNLSTASAPMTIQASQRIEIICTPEFVQSYDQLISGVFSVSATKKIQFAEGNLYYDKVNKEFGIEAFQFAGSPLELSASSANNFGGRQDPTHWTHFIWASNIEDASAYTIKAPAPKGSKLFCVDGGAIPGWTLPTADEMKYLLETRVVNGGSGKDKSYKVIKDAGVSFDGVAGGCGLLLYPDNYKGSYKENTWKALKDAGIVYLPAVGYYNTTNDWLGSMKSGFTYFLNATPTTTAGKADRLVVSSTDKSVSVNEGDFTKLAYNVRLIKYVN